MNIARQLGRAMKFYGGLTIAGAVGVFVLVQGWRLLERGFAWLARTDGLVSGENLHLVTGVTYLAVGLIYLSQGSNRQGGPGTRRLLALGYLAVALNLLLGTGGLYALLVSINTLIPSLPTFDALSVTLLTMSALLLISMAVHRRLHHQ